MGGDFDWSLAVDTGIAFGTVALAAFTGALAWVTSRDVSATREITDLTRQEMTARDRLSDVVVNRPISEGPDGFALGAADGSRHSVASRSHV